MTPKALSATEVETGRACARKWAWRYIAGIRPPPNASAEKGKRLHAIAERYLKGEGTPNQLDPLSELFLEGLPHLPAPGTGAVEHRAEFVLGGLPFVGVMDWAGRSDDLGVSGDLPAILDHKTSKDPSRYGLLERAQHLGNPQSLIYASAALDLAPSAFSAVLRWVYYKTSGRPKAFSVTHVLAAAEVRSALESVVLPTADRLYTLRTKSPALDPLSLEPNPAECDAYGGCPYRDRCQLQPIDHVQSLFKSDQPRGTTMNPFANNQAAVNPPAQINTNPFAGPAATAAPPASQGTLMSKLPPPPGVAPAAATPINGPAAPPSAAQAPAQAQVVVDPSERILRAFRAAAHAFLTALS